MAYYTALIAAWNNAMQPPPGVTGTALTGLTTANKIIAVNGWTVVGPALQANVAVNSIIGAIAPADFLTLTALQLQQMQFLLQSAETIFAPPGGTIRSVFATIFTGKATPFDSPSIPWWQASVAIGGGGLSSPVGMNDAHAAGLV